MGTRARLLLLLPFTALLGVFFAAPLLLMVAISVSRQSFGELQWTFTLHHYARFFSDAYYIGVLWDTLVLGAIVTVASLLLGYPLAYHLARTRSRWKPFLLVAVLSPLLEGIVIRCYGYDPARRPRADQRHPRRARLAREAAAPHVQPLRRGRGPRPRLPALHGAVAHRRAQADRPARAGGGDDARGLAAPRVPGDHAAAVAAGHPR